MHCIDTDNCITQSCLCYGKDVVARMLFCLSLNVVAVGKPQRDFRHSSLRHISYEDGPGKVPSGWSGRLPRI